MEYKNLKFGYTVAACALVGALQTACVQTAMVYTTSADETWSQQEIQVNPGRDSLADIVVSDIEEQVIDGFGGTFGELGWDALSLLPQEKRNEVMAALFGPEGIHFAYGRIPLGANDFARDWYSCNDTPGDFGMKHFNIERDKQVMIPYVKAAMEQNPDLKLWTSPWSPPVWMKATRHYATAPGDCNDFTEANKVEGDHLIQEPAYLEAYAKYLALFVEAYRQNGIPISMLQFQNEPYTQNQWPNCRWTPAAMAGFIGGYLGPLFADRLPEVELYFGTFNCNRMADMDRVMQDADASRYLHGIGLQWEGKDIVADVHRKYPSMKLMQTENECGDGSCDWAAAEHTFDLLETYLNGGVNSYMYFNMVLQDEGVSSWGWRQNSLVRVDSSNKDVVYTPEFYLMKHLSHFVKVGAHKLEVTKGDDVLAFRNPDGETVILCVNKEPKERKVRLSLSRNAIELTLRAKTFNTIIY